MFRLTRSTTIASQAVFFLLYSTVAPAGNPGLSLKISTSPSSALAGKPLTYSLCVSNKGKKTATKLVLTNPLPMDAQLVTAPPDCRITNINEAQAGKKLICKAKRLQPGSSVSWSFVVLPDAVDELVDTATVSFDKDDSNPTNNTFSLSTAILPNTDSLDTEATTGLYSLAPKPTNLLLDLNGPIADKDKTRMYTLPANAVRECDSAVQPGALKAVVTAHNKLAFDLYTAYQEDGKENFVFSTPDVLQTLAMLSVGASGDTLDAVLEDTRTGLNINLQPAMSAAALDMSNRNQTVRLAQHTALWGQGRSSALNGSSYLFEAPFFNTMARKYGSKMAAVDFTDPAATNQRITDSINHWVAGKTNGSIKHLIYGLPERPRLVSASVTSLDGAWRVPPNATPATKGRFELLDGTHVLTPMLSFSGKFPYAEGDGYRAFELPLADSDLALMVLMPGHDRFAEFQSAFNIDRLNSLLAAMTPRRLTLHLPKIRIDNEGSWARIAPKLAESGAFTEGHADFSRVNGEGFLFLDSDVRRTVVNLGENGTQANGATLVIHRANKNEPNNLWGSYSSLFSVDSSNNLCQLVPHWDPALALARPFIFAIRDRTSGSVLFMGQLTEPGGKPAPPDWTTNPCQNISFGRRVGDFILAP
jgi:serpin B